MTLRIPAKVLLHVWLYDFYDMTLSTGKQRRHMIKVFIAFKVDIFPMKIYIVVTDVVNDFTYSRKSVITRVVIRFL